jgi:transposase
MLSFPGSLRVFIALDPIDMRAGINTLHALVAERLKEDVRGGALFVFSNKKRRLIKVLQWDGTGLWLMMSRSPRKGLRQTERSEARRAPPPRGGGGVNRLQQGTFFWPRSAEAGEIKMELKPEAFAMLTDGIDMHGARPRGWYQRGR